MFQWVKPRGSTLCKGLGAVLPLPVKWPRLTGAIGASLQRRHTTCDAWRHIKPNHMKYTDILYQIYHIFQSCTRQSVPNILIYCTKYTIYFKAVLDNLYKIYWYTVPNIPYIWNILIYCTKYTICFKVVLDNLYQIYWYTVPNTPYISKLY